MATILLVMRSPGNVRVMSQALEAAGHTPVAAPDRNALAALLARPDHSRLALVDLTDFGPAELQLCQDLQNHQVRFIAIYRHAAASGGTAMRCGAAGLIQKPVQKTILLQMIENVVADVTRHLPLERFGREQDDQRY